MAFNLFKMGGGTNTKADPTSIPDDSVVQATGCSFDTVGAITSARGRWPLNNGTSLSGSGNVQGHFDGLVTRSSVKSKHRWTKRGTTVYEDFTTAISSGWSSTGLLTGFTHRGYVYLCDGTKLGRIGLTGSATLENWGLTAPGYIELSGTRANPISTTSGNSTITVTVAGGHGLGTSGTKNIELVGLDSVGGILSSDINCVHSSSFPYSVGDVSVSTSGSTLNTGANYTLNWSGQYEYTALTVISIKGGGTSPNLSGGNYTASITIPGTSTANCAMQITGNASVTSGFWRIQFTNPSGTTEITDPIAYNATAAQVQTALMSLSTVNPSTVNAVTPCTITSSTTFTFVATTTATSTATGGGAIGFMRQGPTVAASSGGNLVSGIYYYAYAFYNGVATSNFSANVAISVQANQKVTVSDILAGPAGTTERRIYRTDVNGRQLYEIGRISDNTTTTFVDYAKLAPGADPSANPGDSVDDVEQSSNTNDTISQPGKSRRRGIRESEKSKLATDNTLELVATNLGLISDWVDHDPPPSDLQEVGVLNDTTIGVSGSELRLSLPGNPEHWPLDYRVKPGLDTSETLQTWRPFDRDVILYSDNGLYRLSQVGLTFADARFEEIESPVGLAGKKAVTPLDGQQGHVFLAKSGLYLFDGSRVQEISYPIEKWFTDSTNANYVNPAYMDSAWMISSRDRVFLSYGTSAANDRLMFIDFQDTSNPKFSVQSWAITTLFRERADNTVVGGDSGGRIFTLDTGYSSYLSVSGIVTATNIPWAITSKDYMIGEGRAFSIDEVVLDANMAGASTTIVITARSRNMVRTCTFVSTTNGRQRFKGKCPVYMKGESVQVSISSSSTLKRDLYSIGFTTTPMMSEDP